MTNKNINWDATAFFASLTETNKFAKAHDFVFAKVSGLDGFEEALQQLQSATPAQRQQTLSHLRANALSGNESRAPSWQAQQERGRQSRQFSSVNREQRDGARERLSEHHELRRR